MNSDPESDWIAGFKPTSGTIASHAFWVLAVIEENNFLSEDLSLTNQY